MGRCGSLGREVESTVSEIVCTEYGQQHGAGREKCEPRGNCEETYKEKCTIAALVVWTGSVKGKGRHAWKTIVMRQSASLKK